MTEDEIRSLVGDKVEKLRLSYKTLSLLAKKNETYLQQFVTKGVPKRLPEDVREAIAGELELKPDDLRPKSTLTGLYEETAKFYGPKTQAALTKATATVYDTLAELAGGEANLTLEERGELMRRSVEIVNKDEA